MTERIHLLDIVLQHPKIDKIDIPLQRENLWLKDNNYNLGLYRIVSKRIKNLKKKGIEIWIEEGLDDIFFVFKNEHLIYKRRFYMCGLTDCLDTLINEMFEN